MVTEIRVYFTSLPLITSQGNSFTLGYIDENGKLYLLDNNDPDVIITIIEPVEAQLINENSTFLIAGINENVTLRFSIEYLNYKQYFSYLLVPPLPTITTNDLYNRIRNLLPKNVYNMSNKAINQFDNMATAMVILQIYQNSTNNNLGFPTLLEIFDNIFPISGADGWEYFLTGNNRLLAQTATQYGLLLQHIYQCEINNDTNPYWLAFNISKYIYLWINKQRYVYIEENKFNINTGFVLDLNSLGNRILSGGNNGNPFTITIRILTDAPDSTAPITDYEQQQINQFVRQIVRAGMAINVNYTTSLADLNFTSLGNTYYKDPRQNNVYCIAYNQNVLNEALGYSGNTVEEFLVNLNSFYITPANNTTIVPGIMHQITVFTEPAWIYPDISLGSLTQIYSIDEEQLQVTSNGANIFLFVPDDVASGTHVSIIIYLGLLNYTYTYIVA